jgi:hypothetical protein
MADPVFPEPMTDYQRRILNANLYGYERGRRRAFRLVRVLWLSRRRLQVENADLRARINSIQTVCGVVQMLERDPQAAVRADWINYALHPDLYPEPRDWPISGR